MEQLLHEHLGSTVVLILGVLALFVLGWHTLQAYRGFKGEIIWLFVLGRRRGLEYLKQRRAWLQELHDCGWSVITRPLPIGSTHGLSFGRKSQNFGIFERSCAMGTQMT